MKKYIATAALGLMLATPALAQKYAIKAYDNIGIGKAMTVTGTQPGQESTKSSYNAFGVDFGYTFWRKGANSLEANIGLGYASAGTTFSLSELSYHYAAPAIADEDANLYERYYEVSGLKQHASIGYFTIPVYLQYQYRPLRWLGLKAEAGFVLGFRCVSGMGKVNGQARAWGVFPEYDDLLIDEDYLDDFGTVQLNGVKTLDNKVKGFNASFMCGAGFEFYAYEPVSFELGVRYNVGFTQVFGGGVNVPTPGEYTHDTAPVFYTVADGTQVRSLADYTSNSLLNPLSIHVGVNVRF